MNATYEKKLKVKKNLTRGTYFIRKQIEGNDEIQMKCQRCGKRFWVYLWAAVDGIAKNGACECSACGLHTLAPYE